MAGNPYAAYGTTREDSVKMTQLARRATAHPLAEMFDWLDSVAPFRTTWTESFIPVEEFVEDGHYVVRADLPGIDPATDVDVTIADETLTIHGERHAEEHDKHRTEVHYGSFTRRLRLPHGCQDQDVKATYDAGVLTVSMPIAEPATEPTHVPVSLGGGEGAAPTAS